MLKYLSLFVAITINFLVFSQDTLIKIQNFEEPSEEWNYTTDISFFDNNSDGFFGIHDGDLNNDINDTGFALKAANISSLVFGP